MGKKARLKREYRTLVRKVRHQREKQERQSESRLHQPAQSAWQEAPEDKRENLQSFDRFAGLRNGLLRIAEDRGDWAGIPMPLEGQRLIIEPTYPKAKELAEIGVAHLQEEPRTKYEDAIVRNSFWSKRLCCGIFIVEHEGKITPLYIDGRFHWNEDLETLRSADAWGIEQESNAVNTLAGLVSHRQFKQYMLTGMFIESSKRSGKAYVFRRLRPTVVLGLKGEMMVPLCALCMHVIGYYQGSWAGAMCPTDDIIAHLTLMRGDEKMYWKRANQIPIWRPEAGL